MSRFLARVLLPALSSIALAGCGGGGGGGGSGGGGGGGGPPNPGPTASLVFPPTSFLTDAFAVPLVGTASDADGVQSVAVNGFAAGTGNGFADWDFDLLTPLGDSPVVVSAVDTLGHATPNAASLLARNQGPMVAGALQMGFDPVTDRILVFDEHTHSLSAVDPDTHTGSTVSSATVGSGPSVAWAYGFAVAPTLGRAYIANGAGIVRFDLATGDRVYATGNGVGAGPSLAAAYRVAVDDSAGVGYAGDSAAAKVYQFSLATGDRTLLSGGGAGAGPAFAQLGAFALDATGGRLFVLTGSPVDRVYAVNVTTGDRTLVSGGGVGTGTDIWNPAQMQWDATNGRLVMSSSDARIILSIDPITGARTEMTSSTVGTLPTEYASMRSFKNGLAIDPARGVAWVSPSDFASIAAVSFTTGDWTEIYRPTIGTGPILASIRSATFDPTSRRAFVFAYAPELLIAVDVATGGRSVFAGAGPDLDNTNGMAVDVAHNRLIAHSSGQTPEILTVDLATGARTLVSGFGVGSGPVPQSIDRIAVDAAGTTAYAADYLSLAVFTCDLATGARAIIADAAHGSGPLLGDATAIALDTANGRLYVSDGMQGGRVLSVDLATGARSIVADSVTGLGPLVDFVGAMTFDAVTHRLLLAQNRSILAIDPATGTRTMVASDSVGSGPDLDAFMTSIDVDPLTGFLYATDQLPCRLLLVNPATGDRVVISK